MLEEAENPRAPLLERVRFVSISAGNLDEFYTVRVAGLRELSLEGNISPSDDGRTPAEQLKLINADAHRLMQRQQAAWIGLRKELEEALNLLEQQTYIQRNGDVYEYLTDEEKDIEEEIKRTDIDTSEVLKDLGDVLFSS